MGSLRTMLVRRMRWHDETVGAKQLLFGSDAPPLLPLLPRAKNIIEELPIPESEREDILGRNALRLLER